MVLLILLVIVVVPPVALLRRVVRADGAGHRPPPRSHPRWDEGTSVEVLR